MLSEAAQLGRHVRALRRERSLTQVALACLAGVSRPYLSDVERGAARPSVKVIESVAAALGVHVNDIRKDWK